MAKFDCSLLYNVHAVRLSVSPNAKIYVGGHKLPRRSQNFLGQSSPNLGRM